MKEITKIPEVKKLNLSVIENLRNEKGVGPLSKDSKSVLKIVGTQFNKFLEENNQTISPDSIKEFLSIVKENQAAATYNLKRQELKRLIKEQEEIRKNYLLRTIIDEVFKDVKRINIKQTVTQSDYLTEDKVDRLIGACSKRIGLIVEFLFNTGCRVSEMIGIRLQDMRTNSGVKIQIVGKGSKARFIYISKDLLYRIRTSFKGDKYFFETRTGKRLNRFYVFNEIQKYSARIGLNVHPHTLRHSFAMFLKEKGKSVKYISEALGHSSTSITTDQYFHDAPGMEILGVFEKEVGKDSEENNN